MKTTRKFYFLNLKIYVAALTITISGAAWAAGDAKMGQGKVAMCQGCHNIVGYKTSFPQVYAVPKISGQSETYLVAALTAYKNGDRKHPSMRGIAQSLSEQDISDVAAFYAAQTNQEAVPNMPNASLKLSERGKKLLQMGDCASCHGANFSTPKDGSIPRLAGQYKDYLNIASRSYFIENKPAWGRNHATMTPTMRKAFQEMGEREFYAQLDELTTYFSQLPGQIQTVPHARFK